MLDATHSARYIVKKKQSVVYSDVLSVMRPVPHGTDFPVSQSPEDCQQDSEEKIVSMSIFLANCIKYCKEKLSDLIQNLDLPKDKTELLESRLHAICYNRIL